MYTKSVISLHAKLLQSMAKSILNKTKKQKHVFIVNKNKNLPFQTSLSNNCFLWNKSNLQCSHLEILFGQQGGILIFVDIDLEGFHAVVVWVLVFFSFIQIAFRNHLLHQRSGKAGNSNPRQL